MEEKKQPMNFCQEPSKSYLKMLEECGDDPRSVAGHHAMKKAGPLAERGWHPDWEARDQR
ncbi:hypothetical protein HYU96_01165 [Candidatus Daviesbacteria bacterium]|nr:hypothetical protein [Candidatus Daviesbacteria bacterium]